MVQQAVRELLLQDAVACQWQLHVVTAFISQGRRAIYTEFGSTQDSCLC